MFSGLLYCERRKKGRRWPPAVKPERLNGRQSARLV
jgi:hypothetical protein